MILYRVLRVSLVEPVSRDEGVLKILREDQDGKRYYARSIEWVEYQPRDELDFTATSFPGRVVML